MLGIETRREGRSKAARSHEAARETILRALLEIPGYLRQGRHECRHGKATIESPAMAQSGRRFLTGANDFSSVGLLELSAKHDTRSIQFAPLLLFPLCCNGHDERSCFV